MRAATDASFRSTMCVVATLLATSPCVRLAGAGPGAGIIPNPFGRSIEFNVKWDTWGRRVVAYRNSSVRDEGAIAVWNPTTGETMTMSVISNLVGRKKPSRFGIWDAAAAPDGSVAVTGSLRYSAGSVMNVVAIFEPNGNRLSKLWNLGKYHHHRIAFDDGGALLAMGHRVDENTGSTPLVIRYSPQGQIEQTVLTARMIDWIGAPEDVIEGTAPDIVAVGARVACLFSRTNEVVVVAGDRIARHDIEAGARRALPGSVAQWRGKALLKSGSRLFVEVFAAAQPGRPAAGHTRLFEIASDGVFVPVATSDNGDGEFWPHSPIGVGPKLYLLKTSGSDPASLRMELLEAEWRK